MIQCLKAPGRREMLISIPAAQALAVFAPV